MYTNDQVSSLPVIPHLHRRIPGGERSAGYRPTALPVIETHDRHLRDITQAAIEALVAQNNPPWLFRLGNHAARLIEVSVGNAGSQALLEPLNRDTLGAILARVADWIATSGETIRNVSPPSRVVRDLMGNASWGFLPPLRGIITAPTFGADGALVATEGYHPNAQLLYRPPADLAFLRPPAPNPTAQELAEALHMIVEELLGEFPFQDSASLAHAVALLLLPFVRELIEGPTPLHLIDAPTEGSGKTLLAEVCILPARHGDLPLAGAPVEESEWRKVLTAHLREGAGHLVFDNVAQRLASGSLARALTAPLWTDRVIGTSQTVRCPVRCVWVATGNNVSVSPEIARRCVWIRLDAGVESPAERSGFRHPDLLAWARKHRMALVGAALTVVQVWIAAGAPLGERVIGSFETWAKVMSGILEVASIDGFLENFAAHAGRSDPEREAWTAVVLLWWGQYRTQEVGVRELFHLAETIDAVAEQIGAGSEQARRVRFGNLLRARTDRVCAGRRITVHRILQNATRYRLVEIPSPTTEP